MVHSRRGDQGYGFARGSSGRSPLRRTSSGAAVLQPKIGGQAEGVIRRQGAFARSTSNLAS